MGLHPHVNDDGQGRLGFEDFLGFSIRERSDGRAAGAINVEQRHANLMGNLHGGVIYAASDMLAYHALLSILPHDKGAVTADIQVSMLRGGKIGDTVEMIAEVIKLGRTLAFIETKSFVAGKLIATTKATKAILDV